MKKHYTSPIISVEELEKHDILCSSANDNDTLQYEQDSLLKSLANFDFD